MNIASLLRFLIRKRVNHGCTESPLRNTIFKISLFRIPVFGNSLLTLEGIFLSTVLCETPCTLSATLWLNNYFRKLRGGHYLRKFADRQSSARFFRRTVIGFYVINRQEIESPYSFSGARA
jgi:hypothetical protein